MKNDTASRAPRARKPIRAKGVLKARAAAARVLVDEARADADQRLAAFLEEHFPEEIGGGTAVDAAIRLLTSLGRSRIVINNQGALAPVVLVAEAQACVVKLLELGGRPVVSTAVALYPEGIEGHGSLTVDVLVRRTSGPRAGVWTWVVTDAVRFEADPSGPVARARRSTR